MTYSLFSVHAAGLIEIPKRDADVLLVKWGHYLGSCDRPFGIQAWAFLVAGEPVAVAVSASTVSSSVAGMPRKQVVELARLCSKPGNSWATRPTLRLWREVAAQQWPHWQVTAAVAYSQNTRHEGNIYRFDGWTKVADNCGSSGGGTWTKNRGDGNVAKGRKTLWVWHYRQQTDAEERKAS